MKKYFGFIMIALIGGAAGAGIINYFDSDSDYYHIQPAQTYQLMNATSAQKSTMIQAPNFVSASSMATPAVVHIKSYFQTPTTNGEEDNPLKEFFGDQFKWDFNSPGKQAAGSGVIIARDGYIVTNNHVIENANKVEVVLNDKRTFFADVVGTDPTTDLALLKIDESNLPTLGFGNSDEVQVGEWVLAVGNPFNLTSTVTAGIVSAKGRSLNILNEQYRIESFIQTDAAVNPGNSGGALINNSGDLIGINTAIASETGSFAGYSFAVPANIVRKVTRDLKEYGQVQRGIIGVQIQDINARFAEDNGLDVLNGAYVSGVMDGGAAKDAGIERGDVIISISGKSVNSSSELQEVVGTYRPGDEVQVQLNREGEEMMVSVTLRSLEGTTDLVDVSANKETKTIVGAELRSLTSREKSRLGLEQGVMVEDIEEGWLEYAGVTEGFVITKMNRREVDSPTEIEDLFHGTDGRITIEGIGKDGTREFYSFNK